MAARPVAASQKKRQCGSRAKQIKGVSLLVAY